MVRAVSLAIEFPACLEADFPAEVPLARRSVEQALAAVADADLDPLVRRSPGLKNNDWAAYLRCSIARMVHVVGALSRKGVRRARVLDAGSYFGNVSLMLAAAGHRVDAVDSYRVYGDAFVRTQALMRDAGVAVHDYADVGFDLRGLGEGSFDAVVCLGVIEHVPHTPRPLLESLNRVLTTEGYLVLDTPNQAYLYTRQRLAAGESVMAPIAAQYDSAIPFEGHHREFTPSEVLWMLQRVGHRDVDLELFNYSIYALDRLDGRDLENFWAMTLDPAMREIVMTISRRGDQTAESSCSVDAWRRHFVETEPYWIGRVPEEVRDCERRVDVRAEIAARRTHANLVREIESRDRTIADLHREIGDLQRQRDARLDERVKRYGRRLLRRPKV
jgi:2-polyprenyl-3-methyl-5-hydroxy-6-metoxy-1,4-benzoquinol methylase